MAVRTALGATRIRQFNVVNAFSATLSTSKIAQLSRDSNVAAVVPDLPVTRSAVTKDAGKVKAAAAGIPTSTYCSTDPTSPRLEPEALQTMHVAYDDRSTPSAAKLEDGSGVKVGWIADGLDVNKPGAHPDVWERVVRKLRAGVVWANTFNRFDPTSPFGGYRESGFGREGGLHGLEPYLRFDE
jgi:hypothetical protein